MPSSIALVPFLGFMILFLFYLSESSWHVHSPGPRSVLRDSNTFDFQDDYPRFSSKLYRRLAFKRRDDDSSLSTASTCVNLTVDELKSLPGWSHIESYADNTWGTGSRNYLTYDAKYPEYASAQACIASDPVQVTPSGVGSCQTNNVSAGGEIQGTHGMYSIQVQKGVTYDAQYTVINAATIGLSGTFQVKLKFPGVADPSEIITTSTTFTNTQSRSFTDEYKQLVTEMFNITFSDGQSCTAETSVKSCSLQGTGEIQLIASGGIWFEYDKKVDGHYKWHAMLEDILPNVSDRSKNASIQGDMQASDNLGYSGNCN